MSTFIAQIGESQICNVFRNALVRTEQVNYKELYWPTRKLLLQQVAFACYVPSPWIYLMQQCYTLMTKSCRLRRHRMPILAGTVPCPMCANNPRVIRHTPNYARIFNLEEPWWLKVRFSFWNHPSPIVFSPWRVKTQSTDDSSQSQRLSMPWVNNHSSSIEISDCILFILFSSQKKVSGNNHCLRL